MDPGRAKVEWRPIRTLGWRPARRTRHGNCLSTSAIYGKLLQLNGRSNSSPLRRARCATGAATAPAEASRRRFSGRRTVDGDAGVPPQPLVSVSTNTHTHTQETTEKKKRKRKSNLMTSSSSTVLLVTSIFGEFCLETTQNMSRHFSKHETNGQR